MSRIITFAMLVVLVVLPEVGSAEVERAIQAWQPIATSEGIQLSKVTYLRFLDFVPPGYRVNLTCEPNLVMTDIGEFENTNAANGLGIQSWIDAYHDPGHGLYGDTLRVFLKIPLFESTMPIHRWPARAIVEATLECVLANACWDQTVRDSRARRDIKLGYVDVRILGSKTFADLGRTYAVDAELSTVPRRTLFLGPNLQHAGWDPQRHYRWGAYTVPAEPISGMFPAYPDSLCDTGITGKVGVLIIIDVDGRVVSAKVVQSIPVFDDLALDAAKTWRFVPAQSKDWPQRINGLLEFDFKPQGTDIFFGKKLIED